MPIAVELPVIYCPECETHSRPSNQIATHAYRVTGTDRIVCLQCAIDRPRSGRSALEPLHPDTASLVAGTAAPMSPEDAVQLLERLGSSVRGA